jgi:predicted nucleic acid-binding protein
VLFLDTSAWLPVLATREHRHDELAGTYKQLLDEGRRFVTSNLVVAELHALFARRRGAEAGVQFLEHVHGDPAHQVLFVDRDLQTQAIDRWLRPFRDQRFSLCDAASFELMRQEGIRTAFALDKHFTVAGFEMVP